MTENIVSISPDRLVSSSTNTVFHTQPSLVGYELRNIPVGIPETDHSEGSEASAKVIALWPISRGFKCSACNLIFSDHEICARHTQDHNERRLCPYCYDYNYFGRKDKLFSHIQNDHSPEKISEQDFTHPIRCQHESCFKIFYMTCEYIEHLKKVHQTSLHPCKEYGCAKAGANGYIYKSELIQHQQSAHSHTGIQEKAEPRSTVPSGHEDQTPRLLVADSTPRQRESRRPSEIQLTARAETQYDSTATLDQKDSLPQNVAPEGGTSKGNASPGSVDDIITSFVNMDTLDGRITPITIISADQRRQLIDRVMETFYAMFDGAFKTATHESSSSPNSGQNTTAGANANTQNHLGGGSNNAHRGGRKRRWGDSPDDDDDDGNGDRPHKTPQRPVSFDSNEKDSAKKFACPYFKRNPRHYQKRHTCPGPGWKLVHRMKEHLYRQHAMPIHCSRCFESFDTDLMLKTHQRSTQICDVREEVFIEGFDNVQKEKLQSKKRSDKSEADKWREVYRILFPDDDPCKVPSPYYEPHDSTEFARYEEYLSRELPRKVRQMLEVVADQELGPIEERLKSRLVDIVRTCQEELFSSYQQSLAENSNENDPVIATASTAAHSNLVVPQGSESSTHRVSDDLSPFAFAPPTTLDGISTMNVVPFTNIPPVGNDHNSDSGNGSSDWQLLSGIEPTWDQERVLAACWQQLIENDASIEEAPGCPPLGITQGTSDKEPMRRFLEEDNDSAPHVCSTGVRRE